MRVRAFVSDAGDADAWETSSAMDLAVLLENAHEAEENAWAAVDAACNGCGSSASAGASARPEDDALDMAMLITEELAHAQEALAGQSAVTDLDHRLLASGYFSWTSTDLLDG